MNVNWDDEVPESIRESWPSVLGLLSTKYVPRHYHDKRTSVVSMEPLSRHIPLLFTSEWSALMPVYKLDLSQQRPRLRPSKDSPFLVSSCVELNFLLSSYIMSELFSTYLLTDPMLGLTAPLCYTGLWEDVCYLSGVQYCGATWT